MVAPPFRMAVLTNMQRARTIMARWSGATLETNARQVRKSDVKWIMMD